MFSSEVIQMLVKGIGETLYMTLASTLFGYLFGLPMGILLTISDREGIKPNAVLYKIMDVVANIVRSVPFLILLIMLIPFTRLIVGKSYGSTATIVPLVVAAVPYIARMVESSLREVDAGVIEAARSMGASTFTIVTKVLLVEARTSLIVGVTITLGTILGYSAMAGTVGGGGLGDIAIRYGYHRYEFEIMAVTVILLILLVQIFQTVGMKLSVHLDKSKKQKWRRSMMKKRVLAVLLAGVLGAAALTGCGGSDKDGASGSSGADSSSELKEIKVAASATPHAEILEEAKVLLEEEGYKLDVTVFNDYVQPNEVVESGDFDANYFQHIPYLDSFNDEKGTHLVNAGGIHYEPFGIYPGTKKSLDELKEGDTIAVPNDTTNEARALLLLQDNGVITLKEGAGLNATVNDIEENTKDIKIVELEAAQVSRVVDEVAFVVLNGNYALEAGYSVKSDAIAYEKSDSEAAKTYVNVIAVKEGNEDSEAVKALVSVLTSDDVKKFIDEKYDGAVIAFEE